MGYDVSFHPISPDEIQEWHFTPLTWIQQGQEEKVLALAMQHGIEDFYAEKYLDTLRVGAETEPDELFDKSHGFYIAVIQGFFRDYYYTRGSAFSFLAEPQAGHDQEIKNDRSDQRSQHADNTSAFSICSCAGLYAAGRLCHTYHWAEEQ